MDFIKFPWKVMLVFASFLLIPTSVSSQTSTEMTVVLSEPIAHVVVEVRNPEDFEELKGILGEPGIRGVYRERFSAVFGEMKNLNVYAETVSIFIEFDSALAERIESKRVIGRREFRGNLDRISALNVWLPENTRLAYSSPVPDKTSGGVLTWNNVDFVPEIIYEENSMIHGFWPAAVFMVLVFFVIMKVKRIKRV